MAKKRKTKKVAEDSSTKKFTFVYITKDEYEKRECILVNIHSRLLEEAQEIARDYMPGNCTDMFQTSVVAELVNRNGLITKNIHPNYLDIIKKKEN